MPEHKKDVFMSVLDELLTLRGFLCGTQEWADASRKYQNRYEKAEQDDRGEP